MDCLVLGTYSLQTNSPFSHSSFLGVGGHSSQRGSSVVSALPPPRLVVACKMFVSYLYTYEHHSLCNFVLHFLFTDTRTLRASFNFSIPFHSQTVALRVFSLPRGIYLVIPEVFLPWSATRGLTPSHATCHSPSRSLPPLSLFPLSHSHHP